VTAESSREAAKYHSQGQRPWNATAPRLSAATRRNNGAAPMGRRFDSIFGAAR
jgi:hypothetical protein